MGEPLPRTWKPDNSSSLRLLLRIPTTTRGRCSIDNLRRHRILLCREPSSANFGPSARYGNSCRDNCGRTGQACNGYYSADGALSPAEATLHQQSKPRIQPWHTAHHHDLGSSHFHQRCPIRLHSDHHRLSESTGPSSGP